MIHDLGDHMIYDSWPRRSHDLWFMTLANKCSNGWTLRLVIYAMRSTTPPHKVGRLTGRKASTLATRFGLPSSRQRAASRIFSGKHNSRWECNENRREGRDGRESVRWVIWECRCMWSCNAQVMFTDRSFSNACFLLVRSCATGIHHTQTRNQPQNRVCIWRVCVKLWHVTQCIFWC